MAYSYVWVSTLPQKPNTDYSETGGVNIIRSSMDAGPAKQRKRSNKGSTMRMTFTMSPEQLATFENFVKVTLNGTARFGFPHPRLDTVVEARIVPQSGGDLYTISYITPVRYNVQVQMEILP
jgi:hypothetical protein